MVELLPMPSKRILILGGTSQARDLAAQLVALGHDVTTSLAGVTAEPILPVGKIRQGGFGGISGLESYLKEMRIELLIDATHAFAAQISQNAFAAAGLAQVKIARLLQTPWTPIRQDNWINVADIEKAVEACPIDARLMLTIGRKEIAPFLARPDLGGMVRMIEQPDVSIPSTWTLHLARPPFSVAEEKHAMLEMGISHLVTKNAGGKMMATKLEAARLLQIPVIMVVRPAKPAVPTYYNPGLLLANLLI